MEVVYLCRVNFKWLSVSRGMLIQTLPEAYETIISHNKQHSNQDKLLNVGRKKPDCFMVRCILTKLLKSSIPYLPSLSLQLLRKRNARKKSPNVLLNKPRGCEKRSKRLRRKQRRRSERRGRKKIVWLRLLRKKLKQPLVNKSSREKLKAWITHKMKVPWKG